MTEVLAPDSEQDLAEAVGSAAAAGEPFEVVGGGTRRRHGRHPEASRLLTTASMAGLIDYSPEELVVTVRAGTPLATLAAELDGCGQRLPFEPPLESLVGAAACPGAAPATTIGGVVGTNAAGACRFRSGSARDHVLGVRGVSGRGEAFKAGGRVMKNVTGYDLSKLVTGAFGTLAVLTEITLKVLPTPPERLSAVLPCPGFEEAAALMRRILASPAEAARLAFVPPALAASWPAAGRFGLGGGGLVLGLEGPESGFDHRLALVAKATGTEPVEVERGALASAGARDAPLAQALERLEPLLGPETGFDPERTALVRASVPPSAAPALAATLAPHPLLLDCAGHWVLAAVPGAALGAALVAARAAARPIGGAVVALHRPDATGSGIEPFTPLDPVAAQLHAGIKRGFDPAGVLNPGRMYEGI